MAIENSEVAGINLNDEGQFHRSHDDSAMQALLPQWDININDTEGGSHLSSDVLFLSQTAASLRRFYMPVLISVGLLFNALLVFTLVKSKLRSFSVSPYLLTLSMTDSLFLVSLMLVWMSTQGMDVYNSGGWCQAITYIGYASVFLSMWINVALSIDRFIMVRFPHQAKSWCTPFRAKIVATCLIVIAIAVFLNISLLSGVIKTSKQGTLCVPLPRFAHQVQALSRTDVFINIIFPISFIFTLNVITCRSVAFIYKRRKTVIRTCSTKKGNKILDLTLQRRPRAEVRVTKMVLAISWCYIIFNLPSHFFRILIMFKALYQPQAAISTRVFVWQQCFLFVFFTRLSITFPVFCTTSQAFRKYVQAAFQSCRKQSPYRPRTRRKSVILTENGNIVQTFEDCV